MFRQASLVIITLIFICSGVSAAEQKFPGRNTFPDVPVYELDELFRNFEHVVIVDARSHYEFETLRIKNAVNIALGTKSFDDQLQKLRASTDKPIVFYCNGRTCYKSYEAVRQANFLKVENTYAFDAGVVEWARSHPQLAVLLGKSPIKPQDLISKEMFQSHLLAPKTFSDKVDSSSTIVLDVRDRFQREAIGFFPGNEHWVNLDKKEQIHRYIEKAKRENKTLLIYDAVGKQVIWLQYTLEQAGFKNYYFMENGAQGFYKFLAGQQWDKK